ncbi:serine protease 53-like isoform X2 [Toxorhynchites rutilus septentrionalis]|uniref:serine protease 53-like isoform X2 n=1 Tax=Toxorhynchites rutilus septentrionalis TaxID=329112 RepID=UPI0024786933|nr:serine protease 53-like isoform X2 [Toxorhynchites rutilus septentrionalis]
MLAESRTIAVIVFLLVSLQEVITSDNAFIDDPPDGYYRRTSLDDCPNRFYSEDVSSALGFFILGGLRAFRSEYPHMAAIGWTNRYTRRVEYNCGGSLISSRFVITAGHCGRSDEGVPPDVVRLGDTNLATREDDSYAQSIKIKQFLPHPHYKTTEKYHDIALIELEQDARLDFSVCPICLWPHDDLYRFNDGLQVAGFGVTDFGSDRSPTLQKTTLNYLDHKTCNSMLPRPRSLYNGLTADQFCTKTPQRDTCQGDSGGPIQVELSDVNRMIPYLVGVTSFGTGCWDGSFGVYTKISSYLEWITSIVNVTTDPLACARQSECLSARKFSDSRITPQNNSPFFRVEIRRAGESFNQCSGALIDYRHVVTSAACTDWNGREPTEILASDQSVKIVEIIRHPMYIPGEHYHDIALLTLVKFYNPHKIYQFTAPACIWRNERIPEPIVFYSGYGPDFTGPMSSAVSEVPLKILTALYTENGICDKNYNNKFVNELPQGFNRNFICAENPVELVPEICKLEPGGPISNFRRDNIVPYIYGINTLGTKCGGTGNPFVATRISPYYSWIESLIVNGSKFDTDKQRVQEPVGNEITITQHDSSVGNRGDFPHEQDLVFHRLHSRKPLKVTIYGTQLDQIPEDSKELLDTINTIPLHSFKTLPVAPVKPNNVEIVKAVELGSFMQISSSSSAQTLIQLLTKPLTSTKSFITPFSANIDDNQMSTPNHAPLEPILSTIQPQTQATHPYPSLAEFTIEKSIEHQEDDDRCTTITGQMGKCIHQGFCQRPSLVHSRLSYCNLQLLTVCCPENNTL